MDEKTEGFTTLKTLMKDDPEWKEEQERSIADAHALLDASFKENRDWVVMSMSSDGDKLNVVAMARDAPRKKMGLILFGGPPLTEKLKAEGKVQ